jgi:hypothetical protein
MEERNGAYMVLVEKPERKKHSEDPDVDERIILKCISEKWYGRSWIGFI